MAKTDSKSTTERLLYTRQQVAELLGGVNVAFVRGLEETGRLRPIRLTRRGMVFFERANVLELISNARASPAHVEESSEALAK